MLAQVAGKDPDTEDPHLDKDHVFNAIKEELGPFFSAQEDDRQSNDRVLRKIVDLAVGTDRAMLEELREWTCTMEHPDTGKRTGFAFEPSELLETDLAAQPIPEIEARGRPVDLIVSPLLRARGGTLGYNYHCFSATKPMTCIVDMFPDEAPSGSGEGAEEGDRRVCD
ncbi:hypothetical protein F5X97DRAFT_309080 [Nemania serpens]|nr:hypothetical protein F5X97DRAFT_309080 [Nemania serpens]